MCRSIRRKRRSALLWHEQAANSANMQATARQVTGSPPEVSQPHDAQEAVGLAFQPVIRW